MPELRLDGCNPEPLMSYLKALGVLRLVAEQADTDARGAWQDGVFVLETTLDSDGLAEFLLERYSPTPLLAPWNGGSGFYFKLDLDQFLDSEGKEIAFKDREAVDAINAIERCNSERLARYGAQIRETKRALAALAEKVDFRKSLAEQLRHWPDAKTKPSQKKIKDEATKVLSTMLLFRSGEATFSIGKAAKDEFVSDLRGKVLTDDGLAWLDSALAMRTGQKKNRVEAPTLGSGGNIGNSDFSARFAQLLAKVVPLEAGEAISIRSRTWLSAALFGTPVSSLEVISVDQFDPGKAGGANGTQGMEAAPILNPWNYLLMMEGALALAGNTSRRLGTGRSAASFPFVVDSSPAGHGSLGIDTTRGETWLPLWSAPARFGEVQMLLSEGRAEVGSVRARSGLTFAQAVAGLGVDRGIDSFVRYEFQERLGQNYIATPVGRFNVPQAPIEGIELVRALNQWLDRYRRACAAKGTPERFGAALRRVESAIFDYCRYGRHQDMQSILIALGQTERILALTAGQRGGKEICRPLAGLSTTWLERMHSSVEFEIALALAGVHDPESKLGPFRFNMEPVTLERGRWAWQQSGPHVVWNNADLPTNMAAVLTRRIMDGARAGCEGLPIHSKRSVGLDTIATFVAGQVNDHHIEEILWGLLLVDHRQRYPVRLPRPRIDNAPCLSREYALLKLLFLPGPMVQHWDPETEKWNWGLARDGGIRIRPEPRVLPLLRAGRVGDACRIAWPLPTLSATVISASWITTT